MGRVLGVLLIVAGIFLGVYVDVWLLIVGGIQEIVSGATAQPVNGTMIAWGVVKACVFAGVGIFVAFWLLIMPGAALIAGSKPRLRVRRSR